VTVPYYKKTDIYYIQVKTIKKEVDINYKFTETGKRRERSLRTSFIRRIQGRRRQRYGY